MERNLFICNSVYQVLVALWLKHTNFQEQVSDIVISDHMNNAEKICRKIEECSVFEQVYYVKSFSFSRHTQKQNRARNIKQNLIPYAYLCDMVSLGNSYSNIYVANLDAFSILVYDALIRKNQNLKLYLFEDGMYTYSKLMKRDYINTAQYRRDCFREIIYKYVYKKKYIYGNIEGVYLFHPEDMLWEPDFRLLSMKKIDCKDTHFLQLCNKVFGYNESCDKYDRKYIFMEESFAAEGMPINDLELLGKIAQRVGKENIMVKIHPRNPVNRFAKEGYLTNENTSIPWEIIAMNLEDISDKVFITVASSSVLNPILVLGKPVRAFSLYKLIDEGAKKSQLLSGEFWETICCAFKKYDDMIMICDTIDEII